MRPLSQFLPSAPPAPAICLARGDAFFVRRIALIESEPAAGQVSLAIEGLAPFPPEQLYFGHVASADGRAALVFAAFRRRFEAAETEAWNAAEFVTAEFVPLLAVRPAAGEGVVVHIGDNRLIGLAWRAGDDLPSLVLARGGDEADVAAFTEEVRARAELPRHVETMRVAGVLALRPAGEGGHEAVLGGEARGVLSALRLGGADVRDPEFLAERRRARVRDEWLWRGLLGAAALLALAAVIDLGAGAWSWGVGRQEAKAESQKEAVAQTETAQALANRIAELNEKRLMPFEMLTLVNPSRPDTVIFQRVVTRGLLGLEVEAQATNAEDVGTYSNALKALPALAGVRTRVDGARDGVTRFVLSLDFKAEALRGNGGVE
jgi:hypothetical protein